MGDPLQDPDASPQVNVGVGVWLAAELEDKLSYCLISQVQAPGTFDFVETVLIFRLISDIYPQVSKLLNWNWVKRKR